MSSTARDVTEPSARLPPVVEAGTEGSTRREGATTPLQVADLIRRVMRACERSLFGVFSCAGEAVLLDGEVERALATAARTGRGLAARGGGEGAAHTRGWFEAQVRTYLAGTEWIGEHRRVRRSLYTDATGMLPGLLSQAQRTQAAFAVLLSRVEHAISPWPGVTKPYITRDDHDCITAALADFDLERAAFAEAFALYRAARSRDLRAPVR